MILPYFSAAVNFSANVHQKTDSRSILRPLFSNNNSVPESTKKDVPDYQAHLKNCLVLTNVEMPKFS